MINRNKRDQEAWLREKTLESLKANTYFQEGDIVQIAENSNFYEIISEETEIVLQNELYAKLMPSELSGNIETASKLKTPVNIGLTGDVEGTVSFDGSQDVNIVATVKDDSHNHDTQYNTKAEISHIHSDLVSSISEHSGFFDLHSVNKKYLIINGDSGIKVLKNLVVKVGEKIFKTNTDISLTSLNLDTGSFAVGKDYYVYCCNSSNSAVFKISLNSTYPNGFDANNSRKIGGFHYGDCRRIKSDTLEPINTSGTAWGTSWEDNVYQGILPFSIWTLLFRPISNPEGMVFSEAINKWVDIYLCSTEYTSAYNKTPMTGSEGLMYYDWYEKVGRKVKKFPLSYFEFCSIADGSPNGRDGDNNYAWTNVSNNGRNKTGIIAKAVSSIGCKDCVGNVWEVGRDNSWTTNSSYSWRNQSTIKKGAIYSCYDYDPKNSLHGGLWSDGSHCGSRTLGCRYYPWDVNSYVGCRLASASL